MSKSSILILSVLILASAAAGSYNEQSAIEYAKLAGAAYCWTQSVEEWNCGYKCSANVSDVKVCKGATTKSFVGRWDGKCLLSFQGSLNIKSFIEDLEFLQSATKWDECNGCRVHGGFLQEWESMQDCVISKLETIGCFKSDGLHVTGHSLGAALAGVSMMSLHHKGWMIAESYNFGMPRTGDEAFANEFSKLFGDRFYRLTHHKDPVPQVPPKQLIVDWHFEHPTPEIFYDGSVTDGYKECDLQEDPRCADQYSNLLIDLLHIPDHLNYMGQDTSVFGCPAIPLKQNILV